MTSQPISRSLDHRVVELLRRHSLSVTDSRKTILGLFLHTPDALSHGDIERSVEGRFDRVTIYRTLQTFVEKGLLHTIPTADNAVRYAPCKGCSEGHHHDDHVHFICTQCGITTCLDDVVSPHVPLPEGYEVENVQVVINGICRQCTAARP